MATFDERKELVEELRKQWRMMWRERIDDRVRAEGISDRDYSQLFIERGRIIIATRKFRPPDFLEILQQHELCDVPNGMPPHPSVGGWGKFIRTVSREQQKNIRAPRRRLIPAEPDRKRDQHPKKGGRGWLHFVK